MEAEIEVFRNMLDLVEKENQELRQRDTEERNTWQKSSMLQEANRAVESWSRRPDEKIRKPMTIEEKTQPPNWEPPKNPLFAGDPFLYQNLPDKLYQVTVDLILLRAHIKWKLEDWSSMEAHSKQAHALATKLIWEPFIAKCMYPLGISLYHQRDYIGACEAFMEAERTFGYYIPRSDILDWLKVTKDKLMQNSAVDLQGLGSGHPSQQGIGPRSIPGKSDEKDLMVSSEQDEHHGNGMPVDKHARPSQLTILSAENDIQQELSHKVPMEGAAILVPSLGPSKVNDPVNSAVSKPAIYPKTDSKQPPPQPVLSELDRGKHLEKAIPTPPKLKKNPRPEDLKGSPRLYNPQGLPNIGADPLARARRRRSSFDKTKLANVDSPLDQSNSKSQGDVSSDSRDSRSESDGRGSESESYEWYRNQSLQPSISQKSAVPVVQHLTEKTPRDSTSSRSLTTSTSANSPPLSKTRENLCSERKPGSDQKFSATSSLESPQDENETGSNEPVREENKRNGENEPDEDICRKREERRLENIVIENKISHVKSTMTPILDSARSAASARAPWTNSVDWTNNGYAGAGYSDYPATGSKAGTRTPTAVDRNGPRSIYRRSRPPTREGEEQIRSLIANRKIIFDLPIQDRRTNRGLGIHMSGDLPGDPAETHPQSESGILHERRLSNVLEHSKRGDQSMKDFQSAQNIPDISHIEGQNIAPRTYKCISYALPPPGWLQVQQWQAQPSAPRMKRSVSFATPARNLPPIQEGEGPSSVPRVKRSTSFGAMPRPLRDREREGESEKDRSISSSDRSGSVGSSVGTREEVGEGGGEGEGGSPVGTREEEGRGTR